mgnify:CR=1 FL=1
MTIFCSFIDFCCRTKILISRKEVTIVVGPFTLIKIMALLGFFILPSMLVHQHVRQCSAVFGSVRQCSAVFGSVRQCAWIDTGVSVVRCGSDNSKQALSY